MATNDVITYAARDGAKTRRGGYVPPPPPEIITQDFEDFTIQNPMSTANFRTALQDPTLGTAGSRQQVRDSGNPTYGKTISATMQPDSDGSASGFAFVSKLPKVVEHATMEYYVRWHTDFEWSAGGKIPGLAGFTGNLTGGSTPSSITNPPSGGNPDWFGFGARGMWLRDASGGNAVNAIELVGYLYVPYMSYNTFGFNRHTAGTFPSGIGSQGGFSNGNWWKFKQEIKLNAADNTKLADDWDLWSHTPNTSTSGPNKSTISPSVISGTDYEEDGIHRIWINDTLAYEKTDEVFRFYPEVQINRIQWSMFRGGNSNVWWSSTTGRIDIANLIVEEVYD